MMLLICTVVIEVPNNPNQRGMTANSKKEAYRIFKSNSCWLFISNAWMPCIMRVVPIQKHDYAITWGIGCKEPTHEGVHG